MNKHVISLFLVFWTLSFSYFSKAQSFHNNKIVAHRGAWKNTGAPQNSIASLENAIKLGCVGSEFDVRMTKDEVLVINHDAHYEGMDIEKTDYAELIKKNAEKRRAASDAGRIPESGQKTKKDHARDRNQTLTRRERAGHDFGRKSGQDRSKVKGPKLGSVHQF